MKVRDSFVSNSSVSSFIIKLRETGKLKHLLTDKQLNVLTDWGFTFDQYCARGSVTCNQDDIIYCLVDHKIPFTASCHYGHYSVYYNPKESNKIYFMHNIGAEVETYGIESLKEFNKDELVKIESDTDYINKNKKFHKNDSPMDCGEESDVK